MLTPIKRHTSWEVPKLANDNLKVRLKQTFAVLKVNSQAYLRGTMSVDCLVRLNGEANLTKNHITSYLNFVVHLLFENCSKEVHHVVINKTFILSSVGISLTHY